jgi:cytochrome P450
MCYQLLRDPANMRRLQAEVRNAFATMEDIRSERLLQLPFLNACVQETLRLLPPANGKTAQRTAPKCTIADTHIPAGTLVSSDIYTIQRSPLYWADASSFRPERWIDNGPGSPYEKDIRAAWRPFLIGTRACIGRRMALQSLRFIIANLVFRYDFEMINRDAFVWERDAGSSLIYTDYQVMVRMSREKLAEGVA